MDMENGQAIGGFGTFLESGNHTTEMTTKTFTVRTLVLVLAGSPGATRNNKGFRWSSCYSYKAKLGNR